MLHIGADFFASLDEYIQDVASVADAARGEGLTALERELRHGAQIHPQWAPVADHISTWQEDGEFRVGVRHPAMLDQAMRAEYGDADTPPVPLLRHHPAAALKAADRMDDVLHTRLGIPR